MRKFAWALAAVFFCTVFPVFSQEPEDDRTQTVGGLRARVIPSVTHVGDEVRLVIQADFPKGFSIEPISLKTKLAPFELKSIDKPISVKREGRIVQTVILRLVAFEMGDLKIPSLPVAVWSVAGHRAEANTPPLSVRVVSIGKTKEDKADIRPIKGPAAVSLRYLRDWACGLAAFLLSILLIFKIILRRRKKAEDAESLLPPQERVLRELHRLKEKDLLSLTLIKEHYSGLSDILRRYLERRYGLDLMESTSAEIHALLKDKIQEKIVLDEARQILEKADLVKFAKFTPERAFATEIEKRLLAVVEATKPIPVEPDKKAKRSKRK